MTIYQFKKIILNFEYRERTSNFKCTNKAGLINVLKSIQSHLQDRI